MSWREVPAGLSVTILAKGENVNSLENRAESYTDVNARVVDAWVADGWEWGTPVSHERYQAALGGDWSMVLTPTREVPRDWFFDDMRGKRVLGLASGGGQQMPIFAAMGCACTVLDYSEAQIASDVMVAEREGYEIRTVRADMTRPLPFEDGAFDLIFHPVSNCYVEEVLPIWRECFRVLAPGGRLLAGLDNGFNYVVDDDEERVVRGLPFNPLRDPRSSPRTTFRSGASSSRTRWTSGSAGRFRRAFGFWTSTRTRTARGAFTSWASPRSGPPAPRSPRDSENQWMPELNRALREAYHLVIV